PWIDAVEVAGRVQVRRTIWHAALQRFQQADAKAFYPRDAIRHPEPRTMPLIHLQVARRIVPRFLLVLGVLRALKVYRPAADVLPLEIAPRVRQRVLAADFRRGIQSILALRREPSVLSFDRIDIFDQREIERLAEAVGHLAGRSVDDGGVKVVVLAVCDVS